MVQLFLDCDGVLADFDTYAEDYFGMPPREYERIMGSSRFWDALEAKGDFYRNLPAARQMPLRPRGIVQPGRGPHGFRP